METILLLMAIATIVGGAWIFGVWCGRKAERARIEREAKEVQNDNPSSQ